MVKKKKKIPSQYENGQIYNAEKNISENACRSDYVGWGIFIIIISLMFLYLFGTQI